MKKPLSYSLITLLIIGLISGIGWHGLTTATNRTTTSQTTISESKGTSSSTKQRSAESSSATFSSASASSSNSASPTTQITVASTGNHRWHGPRVISKEAAIKVASHKLGTNGGDWTWECVCYDGYAYRLQATSQKAINNGAPNPIALTVVVYHDGSLEVN